jgi:hypothetical protein
MGQNMSMRLTFVKKEFGGVREKKFYIFLPLPPSFAKASKGRQRGRGKIRFNL